LPLDYRGAVLIVPVTVSAAESPAVIERGALKLGHPVTMPECYRLALNLTG
jgi:hypothetical protein